MYILFSLLAGMLVILCISINGRLALKVGLIQAGITNYLVGLFCSVVCIILTSHRSPFDFFQAYSGIPFYFFLGGIIGSVIMILNSMIINNLSAVYVTVLVFIGQLSIGVFIDYLQCGSIPMGKVIGGLVIVAGLFVYMKGGEKIDSHSAE